MNDVDFSQRTSGDDDERPEWAHLMPKWWYQTPPALRSLRAEFPYWPWHDPEFLAKFDTSPGGEQGGGTAGDAIDLSAGKDTKPDQEAASRQTRSKGERFQTDKRVPSGASGESSPDHEFLEGEEGATAWQKTKRL